MLLERNFLTILDIRLFANAHLLSLYTYFRLKEMRLSRQKRKNNVPEITDLLRYWPMLEIFGGKALEVDYFKMNVYYQKANKYAVLTYNASFNILNAHRNTCFLIG